MVLFHKEIQYNNLVNAKKGTTMIEYISLNEGLLEMWRSVDGEYEFVAAGRDPQTLADIAIRNGGMASAVMCSSNFIEATSGCVESVMEAGFRSSKEIKDLWDNVCSNV
jgi:hypothetical protein